VFPFVLGLSSHLHQNWKRSLLQVVCQIKSRLVHFILYFVLITIIPISYADSGLFFNAPYQVFFTPGGQCTNLITSYINNSKSTIDIQAYSFTSKPIIQALINAERRGVNVRGLFDKSNATHKYSELMAINNAAINEKIDYKLAMAHNKVIIIDDRYVVTGSFNFTKSAQVRNAENVLIIDSPILASKYLNNFQSRWDASESISAYFTYKKCNYDKIKEINSDDLSKVSQESSSFTGLPQGDPEPVVDPSTLHGIYNKSSNDSSKLERVIKNKTIDSYWNNKPYHQSYAYYNRHHSSSYNYSTILQILLFLLLLVWCIGPIVKEAIDAGIKKYFKDWGMVVWVPVVIYRRFNLWSYIRNCEAMILEIRLRLIVEFAR